MRVITLSVLALAFAFAYVLQLAAYWVQSHYPLAGVAAGWVGAMIFMRTVRDL